MADGRWQMADGRGPCPSALCNLPSAVCCLQLSAVCRLWLNAIFHAFFMRRRADVNAVFTAKLLAYRYADAGDPCSGSPPCTCSPTSFSPC